MNRIRNSYYFAVLAWILTAGCLAAAGGSPVQSALPSPTDLVELNGVIPDLLLDIRYATTNNFTGKIVYPSARCFLVRDAALALKEVQADLRGKGFRLKVFDGYRPLSVQRIFWSILPDPRYVADPSQGSRHNRGYAVDLTLTDLQGRAVAMPSEYDDFGKRADPAYMDLPQEAIRNREVLREAMEKQGFKRFATEWWHFDYRGWEDKPVLDISLDQIVPAPAGADAAKPRS